MEKVKWNLHHQAVFDCPKCTNMIIEDLGEFAEVLDMEIKCPDCECEFQLGEKED